MAETVNEDSGVGRSVNGQHSQALSESRSYWDTDEDEDDYGVKPSELYGEHKWKIERFSQINKRELCSSAFEVGGYNWYILIYPQGCDVTSHHLSLFLCVGKHDKLLPGWSHFAQFTISLVNKDSRKSQFNDTLHQFWKKEHDWGWKKFIDLRKLVHDGFLDDSDCLTIEAQVQVIRERVDWPFRSLDCRYRRELVRVYLTNVDQTCRRFVEEWRSKLGKLIEDKATWTSFGVFWLEMDQNSRHRISREKMDALEDQTKNKKSKPRLLDALESPTPIVSVDKDMLVLVDNDVLLLLERVVLEPLPLPPKDEKRPQNRTKVGNEVNNEAAERDERHLTELGRRTVEIFVLDHIFSCKIEVAHQEAIALKMQEELIREDEEARLAVTEQRAERGKKSKKKQAKQKRNKNKGKEENQHDEEEKDSVTEKAL